MGGAACNWWRGGGGGVVGHGAELGDTLSQCFRLYVCGVCVDHKTMPADLNPKGTNSENEKFGARMSSWPSWTLLLDDPVCVLLCHHLLPLLSLSLHFPPPPFPN